MRYVIPAIVLVGLFLTPFLIRDRLQEKERAGLKGDKELSDKIARQATTEDIEYQKRVAKMVEEWER